MKDFGALYGQSRSCDWKRKDLQSLVDHYHITVAEAETIVYPYGEHCGKTMKELPRQTLNWLADRMTKSKHSPEFRELVRAARVMVAAAKYKKAKEKLDYRVENNFTPNNAVRANVECQGCGAKVNISRVILSRAGTRCTKCGGMLCEVSPVDEFTTVADVSERLGIKQDTIRWAINSGKIKSIKQGRKVLVGFSSALKWSNDRNQKSHPRKCEHCGKTFRSKAGLNLHIRDNHAE